MRWRTVLRQGLLPLSKVAFDLSNTWRPAQIHSLLPTTRSKKNAHQSQCKRIQKQRRKKSLAGGVEAVVLKRSQVHTLILPRGLTSLSQRTMVFMRSIAAERKLLLQDRRQRDVEIALR